MTVATNPQISGIGDYPANTLTTGQVAALVAETTPVTVDALPTAASAGSGARRFVSDGLLPTALAAVVGGGAVPVPVYSDGTIWLVG